LARTGRSPLSAKMPAPSVALSACEHVAVGILRALEERRLAPGQRLVETDLAAQFAVGRNAVREAMQQLAARGVVDLSRNRSPSIRMFTLDEVLEVLEVAEAMIVLLVGIAARNFRKRASRSIIRAAQDELADCERRPDHASFSQARRHFYRALLDVARNRELERLFSSIHMEIVYAQYQSASLRDIRYADYSAICETVIAGDVKGAEVIARRHVRRVRFAIAASERSRSAFR
jgi:DNA-binding GntR family transcriptional regulator